MVFCFVYLPINHRYKMKIHILSSTFLLLFISTFSQNLTGAQLLDKAIAYHDPNTNWATFNGELYITMETPDRPNRESKIVINLPEDVFDLKITRDSVTTRYFFNKGRCIISKTDSLKIANQTKKPRRTHCETAKFYKNYYTYLYGLPMKLKDKSTIIHDKVERKIFKDKEYLVLKATYDEAVGSDIWYFYFNPETYAMEIYQFYRMDDEGNQKNDTGEYILLTEEETINGIIMPKNRAWYTNKDDKFLGTDILKK